MSTSPQELFSLQGKIALVTGASSGLGAHFAEVLAAAGATVVAAARRRERLEELVDKIEQSGGKALAVSLDITDKNNVMAALEQVEAEAGPIDVLVNNAGVADSRYSLKVDEESWDFVMDANLKGAWRLAREVAARAVARQAPASIVNIASILGIGVTFGESTYAASKAGLIQLTRSMAMELGRKGVRVNALCPGYFATEMNADFLNSDAGKEFMGKTPMGRVGDVTELSGALLLLASDAGSYINGVALPVDGGHLVTAL